MPAHPATQKPYMVFRILNLFPDTARYLSLRLYKTHLFSNSNHSLDWSTGDNRALLALPTDPDTFTFLVPRGSYI